MTFGVRPDCPHTGYGYIEAKSNKPDEAGVFRREAALSRSRQKRRRKLIWIVVGFFGMRESFCSAPKRCFDSLSCTPRTFSAACKRALEGARDDLNFIVLGDAYRRCQGDFSRLRNRGKGRQHIGCVPLNTTWSDVGSWSELWNFLDKDGNGNVVQGEAEAKFIETSDSLAYSTGATVALVGVSDLVVVAMDDAVLVASKEHAEAIKTLVGQLKDNGQDLALQHNRVYRPWGWYEGLNRGDRYQVKCIMVKPGGKLSLQSHHHRSEHWVVVKGTLEVIKGEEAILLTENQSTYIPIGEKHRLVKPGEDLRLPHRGAIRAPTSPRMTS